MNSRTKTITRFCRAYLKSQPYSDLYYLPKYAGYICEGLCHFQKLKKYGYSSRYCSISEDEWINAINDAIWTFNEISSNYPNHPYNMVNKEIKNDDPELFDKISEATTRQFVIIKAEDQDMQERIFNRSLQSDTEIYCKRVQRSIEIFRKTL